MRAALNTASSLLVLVFFAAPLGAAELEGVAIEPRVRVDGEELQLNGAAVRTRFIFKLYVAGLYLPARAQETQLVLRRLLEACVP